MPEEGEMFFFFSDTCVKCQSLKPFLKEQGFSGHWVNTSEEAGFELAKKYQVRNLPALVVLNKGQTNVIYDTEAIKKCVSMGS